MILGLDYLDSDNDEEEPPPQKLAKSCDPTPAEPTEIHVGSSSSTTDASPPVLAPPPPIQVVAASKPPVCGNPGCRKHNGDLSVAAFKNTPCIEVQNKKLGAGDTAAAETSTIGGSSRQTSKRARSHSPVPTQAAHQVATRRTQTPTLELVSRIRTTAAGGGLGNSNPLGMMLRSPSPSTLSLVVDPALSEKRRASVLVRYSSPSSSLASSSSTTTSLLSSSFSSIAVARGGAASSAETCAEVSQCGGGGGSGSGLMLRSRKFYGSRGKRSTEDFMSEIENLRKKLKSYRNAAADHSIEIALVEAEVTE